MRYEIYADLDANGQMSDRKKREVRDALKSFAGKRIVVSVDRSYNKRTPDQNGFYWKIFIQEEIQCFKEHWGETYSKQQVHEWNKTMFWADEKLAGDEVVKTPCTSTKYSTTEWEYRLDVARTWFMQKFNWSIPYPNEQGVIHYGE